MAHDFLVSQFDNMAQNHNADANISQIFMREIKARNNIYVLTSKMGKATGILEFKQKLQTSKPMLNEIS